MDCSRFLAFAIFDVVDRLDQALLVAPGTCWSRDRPCTSMVPRGSRRSASILARALRIARLVLDDLPAVRDQERRVDVLVSGAAHSRRPRCRRRSAPVVLRARRSARRASAGGAGPSSGLRRLIMNALVMNDLPFDDARSSSRLRLNTDAADGRPADMDRLADLRGEAAVAVRRPEPPPGRGRQAHVDVDQRAEIGDEFHRARQAVVQPVLRRRGRSRCAPAGAPGRRGPACRLCSRAPARLRVRKAPGASSVPSRKVLRPTKPATNRSAGRS